MPATWDRNKTRAQSLFRVMMLSSDSALEQYGCLAKDSNHSQ